MPLRRRDTDIHLQRRDQRGEGDLHLCSTDADYADAFDRLEVLLDAVSEDARAESEHFYGPHGGYGRYTWRSGRYGEGIERVMLDEAQEQGAGWTPLLGGLFGGDSARAVAALEKVGEMVTHIRRQQR